MDYRLGRLLRYDVYISVYETRASQTLQVCSSNSSVGVDQARVQEVGSCRISLVLSFGLSAAVDLLHSTILSRNLCESCLVKIKTRPSSKTGVVSCDGRRNQNRRSLGSQVLNIEESAFINISIADL